MFTTQYSTGEIANIAERDLEAYLDYSVDLSPLLQEHLRRAQSAACQIDPHFGESARASDFLSRFLLCAERQEDNLQGDKRVGDFLTVLVRFWDTFTSWPDKSSVIRVPPGLVSFARFVARSVIAPVQTELIVTDAKAVGINMRGRQSWLIISDKVSYILLDYAAISKQARHVDNARRRCSELALKEIGYLRLHNRWYRTRGKSEKHTIAPPSFLQEAWIYAYATLGSVVGLRSRFYDILGLNPDIGLP